jgi:plastocyanin
MHAVTMHARRNRRLRAALAALALTLLSLAVAGNAFASPARQARETKVKVTFNDTKLALSPSGLQAGPATFVVVNNGTRVHSLAIAGPGIKTVRTPELAPGKSATLKVTLRTGAYMLTFSHPLGLGMSATKWVQVIPPAVVSSRGDGSVVNSNGDTSMCGYLTP